jgi:serine/threonine protein kinase
MEPAAAKAQAVFAKALEVPLGAARARFVAEQCANDVTLCSEVESLLRAHDEARGFLQTAAEQEQASGPRTATRARQSTAAMNAASHAEVFLANPAADAGSTVEEFLTTLPPALRQEVRERIEAGLRIRQLAVRTRFVRPLEEEVMPRLPGFHLERKLGEGSLGVVYAAHDEKLGRQVALKVLRRQAGEPVRRRVLDEARKTAALADPAIVTVFSVLDETEPPAIVMELVDGYPLDRFAEHLNFEQKARLLREVARGLAVAHEHGLVHRDLKPDNILVGPDMRPRILDFGLALSLEEASHRERGFEGTPLYASPEQVRSRPLTTASDVFSLGSLMFKVLAGQPAFSGESVNQVFEAIATTAPPFLREVAVGVPEDLQAICLACLAWNPADRPSASEVAVELGRYLLGEPVRLRPKLYDDLLRQSISQYSTQARAWESQSIISREERDALEVVHRRLLADEDHWIIDARRITLLQTILSVATWLVVVAGVLTVWMLRNDLGPFWRWAVPTGFTATLFAAGLAARRARESVAEATFLAGATLAIAPTVLSWLAELRLMAIPPEGVTQLFEGTFTNQQVLVSSLAALMASGFSWWRLKMTGFAWTTAALTAASYVSVLLLFDWLKQKPETQALWCLPLAALEAPSLIMERNGRVRWTLPFHLVALVALVGSLDIMAAQGPTLSMLGVNGARWPYFDHDRLIAFSFVLNGLLFLALMLMTEKSASLDLRRAGKLLEVLAIVHTLSALFANAMNHRADPYVRTDVWLYLAAAGLFMALAPFRSRWRMLVGGLAGCALGSYLLVDLGLVARKPFIIGLGLTGLLVALAAFAYVRRRSRPSPGGGQAQKGTLPSHR